MQLPEERFEEKTRWRTSSLTRSRCSRSCLLEEEELREEEREKQQPEEELDEELEERTRLRRRSLKEEEFEERGRFGLGPLLDCSLFSKCGNAVPRE